MTVRRIIKSWMSDLYLIYSTNVTINKLKYYSVLNAISKSKRDQHVTQNTSNTIAKYAKIICLYSFVFQRNTLFIEGEFLSLTIFFEYLLYFPVYVS